MQLLTGARGDDGDSVAEAQEGSGTACRVVSSPCVEEGRFYLLKGGSLRRCPLIQDSDLSKYCVRVRAPVSSSTLESKVGHVVGLGREEKHLGRLLLES